MVAPFPLTVTTFPELSVFFMWYALPLALLAVGRVTVKEALDASQRITWVPPARVVALLIFVSCITPAPNAAPGVMATPGPGKGSILATSFIILSLSRLLSSLVRSLGGQGIKEKRETEAHRVSAVLWVMKGRQVNGLRN